MKTLKILNCSFFNEHFLVNKFDKYNKITREVTTDSIVRQFYFLRTGSYLYNEEDVLFYENNCNEIINVLNKVKTKVIVKGGVQSGKTNILIFIIMKLMFIHNYNFVFFNSGQLNILNKQTVKRFQETINLINKNVKFYEYSEQGFSDKNIRDISTYLKQGIKVIVNSLKAPKKVETMLNDLNRIRDISDSLKIRLLIVDDECDIGSSTEKYKKEIKSLIHNYEANYLQITATPYAILLKYNKDKWFDFYKVLKVPKEYKGIDYFFNNNLYKTFDEKKLTYDIFIDLLINAFRKLKRYKYKTGKIIINPGSEKSHHNNAYDQVEGFLTKFSNEMGKKNFIKNYEKYSFGPLEVNDLKSYAHDLFNKISFSNSDNTYDKNSEFQNRVIIGGISVSRGITFNSLLGESIFIDQESKFTASNIMQKSRWFGYHNSDPYVYLNNTLLEAYEECRKLEKASDNFNLGDDYENLIKELNFQKIKIKKL